MSKNRLLFISPHMDDAVLSCGGYIGKLTAYGYPVMVLTLFCGSPEGPLSPLAEALHAEWRLPKDAPAVRREEDRREGDRRTEGQCQEHRGARKRGGKSWRAEGRLAIDRLAKGRRRALGRSGCQPPSRAARIECRGEARRPQGHA